MARLDVDLFNVNSISADLIAIPRPLLIAMLRNLGGSVTMDQFDLVVGQTPNHIDEIKVWTANEMPYRVTVTLDEKDLPD